jgi:hypothetical protein
MESTHFEEQVKDELKSMDQRLTDMEEKLTSMDTKLTQVVDAILGNALTKQGGFVKLLESFDQKIIHIEKTRIHVLDKKVAELEDFKKKVYWILAVLGFIVMAAEFVLRVYTTIKK